MKRTTFYSSLVVTALLVVTGLAQQHRRCEWESARFD